MSAQNKNRQRDFKTYLEAHQRAHTWAEKAHFHRCAGQFAQAKAAIERVQHWLRRITVLETRAGRAKPTGARYRGTVVKMAR
jgi:aminopeptidase N